MAGGPPARSRSRRSRPANGAGQASGGEGEAGRYRASAHSTGRAPAGHGYTGALSQEKGWSSLRFLYTLAMYLVTPIIVMRLLARGVRYRGYHRRWRERFGIFPAPGINGSLWVHAVSVGEVNAAEPLVKALMQAYPDAPLVVTTVTPTGSERVLQLFGESVHSV